MGRRHSIAARKASGDAAKSRIYSIIGKKIQIAAKLGADWKMNPALEMILDKARYYGLPREVIDKAVLKGSGQLEGEHLEEIMYEGYGPAGTALLIKTITSNTNRSAASVKTLLGKHGGSLGLPNSVARQFTETGIIILDGITHSEQKGGKIVDSVLPWNQEKLEEDLLNLPIEDFSQEDGKVIVQTSPAHFLQVKKDIEKLGYHITEADLQYLANNMVTLNDEDMQRFVKLLDAIEGDEDVDMVWHNVEL
ncbi:MAG: YebC/PmpR family DNA-binding transcriptional regulator [candidate division SR1 bacterium]|nr:YebC/PmpR family DNA-binding transcriptional regulator [candidate division SR1 bacterium]